VLVIGVSSLLAFLFFSFIFFVYPANQVLDRSHSFPKAWVLVLMLSIVIPIIIVESTSTIWYPGSRSLMAQQVWQPLFYVSLIFMFVNALTWLTDSTKHTLVLVLISLLGAYSVLLGLDYNHRLVIKTYYQQTLAQGLKKLNLPFDASSFFLIRVPKTDNSDLNTISPMMAVYGETIFHKPISLRMIADYPNPEQPFWRTRFEEDQVGSFNAGPIGDATAVPYKKLWILFYDGKSVQLPAVVNKEDFAGLEVDWKRTSPINQLDKLKSLEKDKKQ
jgi:hypothetical protein